MADPVYDDHRIDLVTVTFAVVLAAAIVFLLAELVPQVVDLMIDRPIAHLYGTGQHAGLAPGLRKSSSGRRAGVP
jgi:hypothetical protein